MAECLVGAVPVLIRRPIKVQDFWSRQSWESSEEKGKVIREMRDLRVAREVRDLCEPTAGLDMHLSWLASLGRQVRSGLVIQENRVARPSDDLSAKLLPQRVPDVGLVG